MRVRFLFFFDFLCIASLFLNFSLNAQNIPCNGYIELCSRRFNEVSFPHSHNATSNKECPVQNQDKSIAEQLNDGIRSMKVPIHYDYSNPMKYYEELVKFYISDLDKKIDSLSKLNPKRLLFLSEKGLAEGALKILSKLVGNEDGRIPFACHGLAKREFYRDFIGDLGKQAPAVIRPVVNKAVDLLKSVISKPITTALGEKNDVGGVVPFTACLIDRGKEKLVDLLVTIREFLDSHPNEVLVLMLELYSIDYNHLSSDFQKSGLIKYAHAQKVSDPWPTLGEMVKEDKRLVVFIDGPENNSFLWLNPLNDFLGWNAIWEYKSVDEFTKKPFNISDVIEDSYEESPANNKLLLVHHVITPGLAGSKDAAKIVNARNILRPRIQKIAEALNHIPNFISIDFYEYPSKDYFDVINELNGVGQHRGNPLWKPQENKVGQ